MIPACLLIVLGLGAIAVDGAVLHATQRSLIRSCAAAADDAAGMIDGRAVQRDGTIVLDTAAAARVARARLAPHFLPGAPTAPARVDVDGVRGTVDVEVEVAVDNLVFRGFPGATHDATIECHTRGRLRR